MLSDRDMVIFKGGTEAFARVLIGTLYDMDPKIAESLIDSVRSIGPLKAGVDEREYEYDLYNVLNNQLNEFLRRNEHLYR